MPHPVRTHPEAGLPLSFWQAQKLPEILSIMPTVGRFVAVLLLTWSMSAATLAGEENFSAQTSRDQSQAQKVLILKMLARLLSGEDANRELENLEDTLERKGGDEPWVKEQSPHLGPRDRKAPCKNFFWKTFTAC